MSDIELSVLKNLGYEATREFEGPLRNKRFEAIRSGTEARVLIDVMDFSLDAELQANCENLERAATISTCGGVLSIVDTLFVKDLFVAIRELPAETQTLASKSNQLPRGIWGLASDLVSTLRFLHRSEYVHAALSPWSIYVNEERAAISELWWMHTSEGEPLCSATSEQVTKTIPAEYRSYMAPEQLLGSPPSRESDLYSLGAILYFALTGESPRSTPLSAGATEGADLLGRPFELTDLLKARADATMAAIIRKLLQNQDERINIFMLEAVVQQRMEAGTRG